jgi:hypothetical protein
LYTVSIGDRSLGIKIIGDMMPDSYWA